MKNKIKIRDFDDLNTILIYNLSVNRTEGDFYSHLNFLFKRYRQYLENIDDNLYEVFLPENKTKSDILQTVNSKIKKICEIYRTYSNGNILSAETKMRNLIYQKDHRYKMFLLDGKENWYRARRLSEKDRQFSEKEMFHVPFNKRHLVENYRYSLSGYPCLYLGKTILTCWEELQKPSLYDFCVSQFTLIENVKVLDLTLPDISPIAEPLFGGKTEKEKKEERYLQLITWPLILACSVPALIPNAPFKPEYVIPQLLMRVIVKMGTSDLYGIAYTSARRDSHYAEAIVHHMNIALPVRKVKKEGYCEELCSKLSLTRGVPYMEAEIKNGFHSEDMTSTDDYRQTRFYQLEQFLKSESSSKINS